MPLVDVQSDVLGTTQIVAIRGEIDLASVETVRHALDGAFSRCPETIVLDLSEVAFCDSSGIHMVVCNHRRAAGRGIRFLVVRPTGPAWRPFEVCQIDRQVTFIDPGNGKAHTASHADTTESPNAA
ncbi:MAG TPA: STAS domain-containing protein [Thermoleophilaceae bacterium]|nr:STAS domain-containing protein [Thermoleophilaceae bacterium]